MRPVSDWEEKDIDDLYRGQIMESLTLEYKASGALKNDDHQKSELFKDVSAMANSSGGIIVYGMREKGHLPQGTDDGLDPRQVTREWIENILTSNIQPKIEDLIIKPVALTSKDTGNVAYVLEIPQAKSRGPHQGPEHKYYKRHNFKAEPMEDYEVRDSMRRSIEYGRKFGAAFDLFIEISRLCSTAKARIAIGGMTLTPIAHAMVTVSPDLRSAGSVLVLMSRAIRNMIGEIMLRVDAYNANLETSGSERVIVNQDAKMRLEYIDKLGDKICIELRKIMDNEP